MTIYYFRLLFVTAATRGLLRRVNKQGCSNADDECGHKRSPACSNLVGAANNNKSKNKRDVRSTAVQVVCQCAVHTAIVEDHETRWRAVAVTLCSFIVVGSFCFTH